LKRKILLISILIAVVLLFPHAKASAQTPPFPQINQTMTYNITGDADWDFPLDVTIGFSATAKFTVINVPVGGVLLRQEVTGTPTWPTSTGSGGITYFDWDSGTDTSATSNTSFGFTSTGEVSLADSDTSGTGGDTYSYVSLNWTSGSDTIGAYVGLHTLFIFIPLPLPPLFLTDGSPSFFYWNTSLDPWTLSPTTTAWNAETVSTAVGVRNSLRNTTSYSTSVPGMAVAETLDIWIDFDSSILLKMIKTTYTDVTGVWDVTFTTNIDIVSCNFFGILGTLMFTFIAGIPLLFLIIAAIVILIIVLLIVCIVTRRKK
jgi:hypothetical protein